MFVNIRNPKKKKAFEIAFGIFLLSVLISFLLQYLMEFPVYDFIIIGSSILISLYFIAIIPDIFYESKREEAKNKGLRKQWIRVNKDLAIMIFISIGLSALGLVIQFFTGSSIIVLTGGFLVLASIISSILLIAYFGIRKPDMHREGMESIKPAIIPLILILVFSYLGRNYFSNTTEIIAMFVIALIVVGIAHLWQKRMK